LEEKKVESLQKYLTRYRKLRKHEEFELFQFAFEFGVKAEQNNVVDYVRKQF
jgi:hypothetical protein